MAVQSCNTLFTDPISLLLQIVNVAVRGVSVLPVGVEINPALILINPQGLAVWGAHLACQDQETSPMRSTA